MDSTGCKILTKRRTFIQLHAPLHYLLDDGPRVVHVEVHLRGEVFGLGGLGPQNLMVVVVSRGSPGHESQLEHVGVHQHGLGDPLGQLIAVVLQLQRQDCRLLALQLFIPLQA